MIRDLTLDPYRSWALHLIRGFLRDHRLDQTLSKLEIEAPGLIDDQDDDDDGVLPAVFSGNNSRKPLLAILEEYNMQTMQKQLEHFSVNDVDSSCDEELHSNLHDSDNAEAKGTRLYSPMHSGNILCVASTTLDAEWFDGSDGLIAAVLTGAADASVCITDMANDLLVARLEGIQSSPVLRIAVNPAEPSLIATTGMDGTATLYNLATHSIVSSFKDHFKYVTNAEFSMDGSWLVTGSYDRTVNVYHKQDSNYAKRSTLSFKGAVESLCFLPDQESILVVGVRDDNYLHYIALHETEAFGVEKCNINANGDDWVSFVPMCIQPSPSGKHLLVYTDASAGRLIVYQSHTSRIMTDLWGVETDALGKFACCWHPEAKFVFASNLLQNNVDMLHISSGSVFMRCIGHSSPVRAMCFDSTMNALISCSFKEVMVWKF